MLDVIEKDVEIQQSQAVVTINDDENVSDGNIELIVEEFNYLEILWLDLEIIRLKEVP